MPENPSQKPDRVTDKLLAWARKTIDKIEEATQAPEAPRAPSTGKLTGASATPAPAADAPAPPTGLPGRSSRLTLPGAPAASAAPSTTDTPAAPVRRAADTGSLVGKAGSGPLPPGAPPSRSGPSPTPATRSGPLKPPAPALDPQAAAEASERRMAVIVAYMKEPGHPDFQDKPALYALVTEERSYQQALVAEYNAELKRLAPGELPDLDDPAYVEREMRRGELEARIEQCKRRQAQLFSLLKGLTGIKGKTGGTGFLGQPDGSAPI